MSRLDAATNSVSVNRLKLSLNLSTLVKAPGRLISPFSSQEVAECV